MLLVCHVILQDHMIKEYSNIMGENSSWQIPNLPCLVAIGTVKVKMILVCHMILQEHMIKGSCDFIDRSPSKYFIILLNLVTIDTLIVET